MSHSTKCSYVPSDVQDTHQSGVNGDPHGMKSVQTTDRATSPISSTRSEVLNLKSPRSKTSKTAYRGRSTRVAFHRVITSIFNNAAPRNKSYVGRSPSASNDSSTHSRSGSFHDSLPSLEVVSPGTFLFSGPSLKSFRSGSFSNPASRKPSLAETGSDQSSLRRVQSDLISMGGILLDDEILEPLVEPGLTRTMSDVLLGIDSTVEEVDVPMLEMAHYKAPSSPERIPANPRITEPIHSETLAGLLLPFLDFASWKTLRLASRSWYIALNRSAPPKFPPAFRVPVEILQQIYHSLSPREFNAARHTCRNWMRASLNRSLLVTMLNRGGWLSGIHSELESPDRANAQNHPSLLGNEWHLSRRLSRECALSSPWTGNGLKNQVPSNAFTETSLVDFSDLSNGYPGSSDGQNGSLVFTTSICGKFLLVARETLIFVYGLRNGSLLPLSSVVCPRRVLAMSMDATSGRNAVAALLEGRMGLVCELRYGRNQDSDSPVDIHVESKGIPCRTTSKTSVATSRANEIDAGGNTADRTATARQDAQTREHQHIAFDSVDVHANRQAVSLQGTDNDQTHHANLINQTWNLHLRGPPSDWSSQVDAADAMACPQYIPTEKGTSTFYRHLCSEDDPPRSVSICPQRRCVAFGCSAGIELHWIDALTGQSLTRWFPLTAPSDYLYFLPPRPGFESAKKLRLISSAAHPDDRPAICRKFFVGRPAMSAFWGNLGFENCSRPLGSSSCDHYHAVPLSDGHHVLFMDPQSDMLFLGCDAPLGGPTKLLRKIKFIPPRQGMVPRLYTAAADLTWGARVVVVFGDTVVFYSVPPDICNLSRLEQKAESWDVYSTPPFSTEGRDENHWLNWLVETRPTANAGHNPIWPIAIHGTEIGVLRGICDLAILTQPDVTIWAFSVSSNSKVWQLRSTGGQNQASRYVCRSGIVQEAYAVDGASDDTGAAIKAPEGPLVKTKNGIMFKRLPHALSIENDEWVDFVDVVGCDAWYEQSGDVVVCHGSPMLMDSWDLDGLSDCLL